MGSCSSDEAERMWTRLLAWERSMQVDQEAAEDGYHRAIAKLHEKLRSSCMRASQAQRHLAEECYMKFLNFFDVGRPGLYSALNISDIYGVIKPLELEIAVAFQKIHDDTSAAIFEWLEDRPAGSAISSPRIFGILTKFLALDQERRWETRHLKVFWRHSDGVSASDLVTCLDKVAKHYSPKPEVEAQEKFMQTAAKRASFLNACSSTDIAIWFSNDVERALTNKAKLYDEMEKRWARKENTARYNWDKTPEFPKLANAMAIDLPITSRHDMAKECLSRLELARHMSPDLNPHDSLTLTSVMSTVISPEVQTLKALKNETKLYHKAVAQVEELSDRHLNAYDALKREQFETLEKFFQTCQKEKEDVVKEALYTKAKCLATIERAGINEDVQMTSEDLLKRMLQEAGGAFKKVEGKHKVESVQENAESSECALCYSKFSKKRKRAFLDPCGHASACFECATRAWEQKPNCPWCKAIVEKPISLPAKLFF